MLLERFGGTGNQYSDKTATKIRNERLFAGQEDVLQKRGSTSANKTCSDLHVLRAKFLHGELSFAHIQIRYAATRDQFQRLGTLIP